jgi:hypothetical protein
MGFPQTGHDPKVFSDKVMLEKGLRQAKKVGRNICRTLQRLRLRRRC